MTTEDQNSAIEKPKILICHSSLSDRWYATMKYKDEGEGRILAINKIDITTQMKAIFESGDYICRKELQAKIEKLEASAKELADFLESTQKKARISFTFKDGRMSTSAYDDLVESIGKADRLVSEISLLASEGEEMKK